MKTVEKIPWEFKRPDHNCKCMVCPAEAEYFAMFGNFKLPVCLSCSYLDEEELLKSVRYSQYVNGGGKNG